MVVGSAAGGAVNTAITAAAVMLLMRQQPKMVLSTSLSHDFDDSIRFVIRYREVRWEPDNSYGWMDESCELEFSFFFLVDRSIKKVSYRFTQCF